MTVYARNHVAERPLRNVARLEHEEWSRADRAVARVVDWYLRRVAARSTCASVDVTGRPIPPDELERRVDELLGTSRPILLVYWISDTLTLATIAICMPQFSRLLRNVCVLVDSTLAGRSTGRFLEAHGARYAMLGPVGGPGRLSELSDLMRSRSSCAIAVDGGGPYLSVRPGLAAFAMSVDALVVPLAAVSSRAIALTPRSRVRLPLPRARITAALGTPQVLVRDRSRTAQAESVAAVLGELRRRASASVAPSETFGP